MWHTYYAQRSIAEALDFLAQYGDDCRIIAGGTDLILELERGLRKQQIIVDVSRIPDLDYVRQPVHGAATLRLLELGPLATHNQVVASPEAVANAFPLRALVGWSVRRRSAIAARSLATW